MKNRLKHFVAFLFVIATSTAYAQDNFPINLETVLKLAGANNLTVQEYQLKYQQALAEQSKAKEWWLPDIYAGVTTHYLNGAAMNGDGKIFTNVSRDNIWAGFGIETEIDFSNGIYQSLAAKQKSQAAKYFSTAGKNQMILKAVQLFFDMQTEQLKYTFLRSLVYQADTVSQQIKIKVDAGLLYQSDYLMSQSNYRHLKITMLQAKMEWQKKSAELTQILNLGNNIKLVSTDTALIPVSLNVQQIDTNGFVKRPEYLGLNTELQSFQTLRKTANQGLFLPKLIVGFNEGAFGAYSAQTYNTYQINASLLWSLPFGRLTYQGDLKKIEAQIHIQENQVEQFKNQYQLEISTASSQLEISEEQMTISKEALQFSTEALSQSIARQKIGTAKPYEVFQAQQFFMQAQVDYLKAISEYNKAQFALKVAMGDML